MTSHHSHAPLRRISALMSPAELWLVEMADQRLTEEKFKFTGGALVRRWRGVFNENAEASVSFDYLIKSFRSRS